MKTKNNNIFNTVLSAMFLALAIVLPFFTGQIPKIGNMLCPMHIPILLCGFFCGPWYALAAGILSPIIRSVFFGMPPLIPKGIAMSLELGVYGLSSGLLYNILPKKKYNIYTALIGAMILGRIVWGIARAVFYGLGSTEFGWSAFIAGGFTQAIPGIIIQIVLIPILVMTLKRYTYKKRT